MMSIFQQVALKAYPLADGTDCSQTIGIYVGTTGNVAVEMWDQPGVTTTFVAVPAGTWLPISIRKAVTVPASTLGVTV